MDEAIVSYKCPNCGAPLAFGIESQKWDCHFCNSSFTPAEIDAFEAQKGTEVQEVVQETWTDGGEQFTETETTAYTCPSCGGSVITEANTAATFCVYCHSPTIIAAQLKGQKRPAKLIPFMQTKEAAAEALKKFCRKRPFLPRTFSRAALKGEVTGLYVPYWLYSAEYNAMLRGTATRVTRWSDSQYRYTKTDTYRVERGAWIPLDKVPVDASKKMDDKLMDGLEPYSYNDLKEFTMQYLSGHQAESYDVDSVACGQRFDARAQQTVHETLRGMVNGYTAVTSSHVEHSHLNRRVEYVMLPVWTIMVPYGDKTYTFAMNGQTGKIVGKLPVNWPRVGAFLGGIWAAASVLFFLGGALF